MPGCVVAGRGEEGLCLIIGRGDMIITAMNCAPSGASSIVFHVQNNLHSRGGWVLLRVIVMSCDYWTIPKLVERMRFSSVCPRNQCVLLMSPEANETFVR